MDELSKSILTSKKINFFTEDISFDLQSQSSLTDWLLKTIQEENLQLGFLNFIFCSDQYLLKLNQEHLNHDTYTDVIGFPYSTDPIEGDIFISIDRVKENAQTLKLDFDSELHRVMIHGLLHFLGYKDKSPEEKEKMTNQENFYLNQLSL